MPAGELTAAGSLNGLRGTVGLLGGPALAGVLIALAGLPVTYGLDVVSFLVSLTALALMRAVPPALGAARPSLRGVVEGVRYARSRPDLLGTYAVDLVAMFFGMPSALFPAIAATMGGPGVLGLLYAAPAAGSALAFATSGWTARVHRQGRAVILAAVAWGIAITGFGVARSLPLLLLALAAAGGADGRQRDLPHGDLEPHHPRFAARPPGLHRAAQLHDGPTIGQRGGGRCGYAVQRASVDPLGRAAVRGRLPGLRPTPAGLPRIRCSALDSEAGRCYQQHMKVREVMTQVVLTSEVGTTIAEAASLMAQRRVGSALVVEGQRLLGIFTERDIVKALSQDASATHQAIGHWMTRNPQTISSEATIEEALQRMVEGGFRHLPVVDDDRMVGMLSMRDISRTRVQGE